MNLKKQIIVVEISFWITVTFFSSFAVFGGNPWLNIVKLPLYIIDMAGTFYAVKWWLYPKYYKKGKVIPFILLSILVIGVFFPMHHLITYYSIKYNILPNQFLMLSENPALMALFITIFYYFSSLGFCFWTQKRQQDIELKALLDKKMETELFLLQNQIQPHFLLNTLNNLYILTLEKSQKTPATILKLSDLLRYVTYESNNHFTPLARKIEAIKNYIDVMQIKHQEELKIHLQIQCSNTDVLVPGYIALPLLENAFKHSNIGYEPNGYIILKMQQNYEQQKLLIEIENSIACKFNKTEFGGVGLHNVRKRLELLFPEEDILFIEQTEKKYIAKMLIPYKLNDD